MADFADPLIAAGVRRASLEVIKSAQLNARLELDLAKFESLRKGLRIGVIRAANRAAKPLRAAITAHAAAIARYHFLEKSIGTKTKIYPRGSIVTVVGPKMSYLRVKGKYARGPLKGQGRRHRPYLYSWLLERGTKRSRKRPFIRPVVDQLGNQYHRELSAQIEAELMKLLG